MGLTVLLLAAVGYLIYRVNRLEQLLELRPRSTRSRRSGAGPNRVVPILRDDIEPGPFRSGARKREQPPTKPEDE